MRLIRKLTYKLGFRPKYPSLFFSPSLHVLSQSNEIQEELRRVFDQKKED